MISAEMVQHLPKVHAVAARLAKEMRLRNGEIEFGDLVGYGVIGLVDAASRFDPTRGVAFSTFAHHRVRGAMVDGLRHTGRYSRADYDRYRENPDQGITFVPIAKAAEATDFGRSERSLIEDRLHTARLTDRLGTAIATLPMDDRQLVEGYFFRHRTLDQLGAERGRSKSWTCRLLARALRRLRIKLEPLE